MPLYDFVCSACGHNFEEVAHLGQLPDCPSCQSKQVNRQWSAPKQIGKARDHRDMHHMGNRAAALRAGGKTRCC